MGHREFLLCDTSWLRSPRSSCSATREGVRRKAASFKSATAYRLRADHRQIGTSTHHRRRNKEWPLENLLIKGRRHGGYSTQVALEIQCEVAVLADSNSGKCLYRARSMNRNSGRVCPHAPTFAANSHDSGA